jgi:hypothetical protein
MIRLNTESRINAIRERLTLEERRTHAHYTAEALVEYVTEVVNDLMDGTVLDDLAGQQRLALLEAVCDKFDALAERPLSDR